MADNADKPAFIIHFFVLRRNATVPVVLRGKVGTLLEAKE